MIRLIKDLWKTPGSETDPEEWATRFCAHQGLAALTATFMLSLYFPAWLVLLISLIGYGVWEGSQWWYNRYWLIWWDSIADWVAWAAMTFAVVFVSGIYVVLSLLLLTFGVYWRRRDRS